MIKDTRPVLRNQNNPMWPYTTNFASDGFDGYTVVPRWATRIYYNCDNAGQCVSSGFWTYLTSLRDCTTLEWINTSAGQGGFFDLLVAERTDTMRHLFGLFHDGYMFHQANLRTQSKSATQMSLRTC